MTEELIARLRARHTELLGKIIASDQGPTIFSEAADDLARLQAEVASANAAREAAEARVAALEARLRQIDGMSFDMRPGQMIEIRRVVARALTPEAGEQNNG